MSSNIDNADNVGGKERHSKTKAKEYLRSTTAKKPKICNVRGEFSKPETSSSLVSLLDTLDVKKEFAYEEISLDDADNVSAVAYPNAVIKEELDIALAGLQYTTVEKSEYDNSAICREIDVDTFLSSKYLVSDNSLLELFESCFELNCDGRIEANNLRVTKEGTATTVGWRCIEGHSGSWTSQPILAGNDYRGNVELSTAIALTNCSHRDTTSAFGALNVQIPNESEHDRIVGKYAKPSMSVNQPYQ